MPEQPHRLLWERVKQGLAEHGALKAGAATEREIAAHAEKAIGEELGKRLVRRFVDGYYLPKMYAPASARLTEAEAEGLVAQLLRELDRLPRQVASDGTPTATSGGQVGAQPGRPSAPAKRSRALQPRAADVEAVAYGDDRVLQALHERFARETRELEIAREEVKRREEDLATASQELDRERQKLSTARLALQQELAVAEERRTEAEEVALQARLLRVEQEELAVRAAEEKAEAEAAALEAARKTADIEQQVVALTQRKIAEEQKILALRSEGESLHESVVLAALDKELQLQQLQLIEEQKDQAQRDLEELQERQREVEEKHKRDLVAGGENEKSNDALEAPAKTGPAVQAKVRPPPTPAVARPLPSTAVQPAAGDVGDGGRRRRTIVGLSFGFLLLRTLGFLLIHSPVQGARADPALVAVVLTFALANVVLAVVLFAVLRPRGRRLLPHVVNGSTGLLQLVVIIFILSLALLDVPSERGYVRFLEPVFALAQVCFLAWYAERGRGRIDADLIFAGFVAPVGCGYMFVGLGLAYLFGL